MKIRKIDLTSKSSSEMVSSSKKRDEQAQIILDTSDDILADLSTNSRQIINDSQLNESNRTVIYIEEDVSKSQQEPQLVANQGRLVLKFDTNFEKQYNFSQVYTERSNNQNNEDQLKIERKTQLRKLLRTDVIERLLNNKNSGLITYGEFSCNAKWDIIAEYIELICQQCIQNNWKIKIAASSIMMGIYNDVGIFDENNSNNLIQLISQLQGFKGKQHLIFYCYIFDQNQSILSKHTLIDVGGFSSSLTQSILNQISDESPDKSKYVEPLTPSQEEERMAMQLIEQDCLALRDLIINLSNGIMIKHIEPHSIISIIQKLLINPQNEIILTGFLKNNHDDFHENLNTLEFCSRFTQTLQSQGLKDLMNKSLEIDYNSDQQQNYDTQSQQEFAENDPQPIFEFIGQCLNQGLEQSQKDELTSLYPVSQQSSSQQNIKQTGNYDSSMPDKYKYLKQKIDQFLIEVNEQNALQNNERLKDQLIDDIIQVFARQSNDISSNDYQTFSSMITKEQKEIIIDSLTGGLNSFITRQQATSEVVYDTAGGPESGQLQQQHEYFDRNSTHQSEQVKFKISNDKKNERLISQVPQLQQTQIQRGSNLGLSSEYGIGTPAVQSDRNLDDYSSFLKLPIGKNNNILTNSEYEKMQESIVNNHQQQTIQKITTLPLPNLQIIDEVQQHQLYVETSSKSPSSQIQRLNIDIQPLPSIKQLMELSMQNSNTLMQRFLNVFDKEEVIKKPTLAKCLSCKTLKKAGIQIQPGLEYFEKGTQFLQTERQISLPRNENHPPIKMIKRRVSKRILKQEPEQEPIQLQEQFHFEQRLQPIFFSDRVTTSRNKNILIKQASNIVLPDINKAKEKSRNCFNSQRKIMTQRGDYIKSDFMVIKANDTERKQLETRVPHNQNFMDKQGTPYKFSSRNMQSTKQVFNTQTKVYQNHKHHLRTINSLSLLPKQDDGQQYNQ